MRRIVRVTTLAPTSRTSTGYFTAHPHTLAVDSVQPVARVDSHQRCWQRKENEFLTIEHRSNFRIVHRLSTRDSWACEGRPACAGKRSGIVPGVHGEKEEWQRSISTAQCTRSPDAWR